MTRDEMKEVELRMAMEQVAEEKRHNKAMEGVTRRGQDWNLIGSLISSGTKVLTSAVSAATAL